MIIKGACATTSIVTDCNVVQLKIKISNPQIQIVITATGNVLEEICHPLEGQSIKLAKNNYPHLEGINVTDVLAKDEYSKRIDILIGGDYYYEFMTGVTRKQFVGRRPVAILTKFGRVLGGPLTSSNTEAQIAITSSTNIMTEHTLLYNDQNSIKDPLLESVENFWNMDCLGINIHDETSVYDTFLNELQYNVFEKRYEVGLPWKLDSITAGLTDNFINTARRFRYIGIN